MASPKFAPLPPGSSTPSPSTKRLPAYRLAATFGFAVLAVCVHGYHPYSEDAAIYIPAIKKLLDPSLYPHASEFFLSHARFSLLSRLIALSVVVTRVPLSYALLRWHLLSVALTLAACWRVCEACLPGKRSAMIGTALIAGCLTVPIAGTSLLMADPYLTGRALSTPALLFAIAAVLEHRPWRAATWLGVALLMHPLMAVYGGALALTLFALEYGRRWLLWGLGAAAAITTVAGIEYAQHTFVSESYRAAVMTRSYLFLANWEWYEVIGLIAPLAMFAWLAWKQRDRNGKLANCGKAVVLNGVGFLIVALATVGTPVLPTLARYQPLRSFHLIYLLMFLLPVNLGLQKLASVHPLIPVVALAMLYAGMFTVARQTFPASPHVEWPWIRSENPWRQAFDWTRNNTPKDAVFALNPDYMEEPSEDSLGFRAYAERASLADRSKDGGVVALFPRLSQQWYQETNDTAVLRHRFSESEFSALQKDGATWVVIRVQPLMPLHCPYNNGRVAVCHLSSNSTTFANAIPPSAQSTRGTH